MGVGVEVGGGAQTGTGSIVQQVPVDGQKIPLWAEHDAASTPMPELADTLQEHAPEILPEKPSVQLPTKLQVPPEIGVGVGGMEVGVAVGAPIGVGVAVGAPMGVGVGVEVGVGARQTGLWFCASALQV